MQTDARFPNLKQFDIVQFELFDHAQFLQNPLRSDFTWKQCSNIYISLHSIISYSRTYCLFMRVFLAVFELASESHGLILYVSLKGEETIFYSVSEDSSEVGVCALIS